jgi:hypothetical protein
MSGCGKRPLGLTTPSMGQPPAVAGVLVEVTAVAQLRLRLCHDSDGGRAGTALAPRAPLVPWQGEPSWPVHVDVLSPPCK